MATNNKTFKHDEYIKNIMEQVAVAYRGFNDYTKDIKDEDLLEKSREISMLFCDLVTRLSSMDAYLYAEDMVNFANGNDTLSAIEHARI